MKSHLKLGTLFSLTIAASLFGSYNTDALDGVVTCELKGGGGSVVINANRRAFTVKLNQGKKAPQRVTRYIVSKRDSDGDSSVQYNAKKPSYAILTLSDKEDTIEIDGAVHALTCPE